MSDQITIDRSLARDCLIALLREVAEEDGSAWWSTVVRHNTWHLVRDLDLPMRPYPQLHALAHILGEWPSSYRDWVSLEEFEAVDAEWIACSHPDASSGDNLLEIAKTARRLGLPFVRSERALHIGEIFVFYAEEDCGLLRLVEEQEVLHSSESKERRRVVRLLTVDEVTKIVKGMAT